MNRLIAFFLMNLYKQFFVVKIVNLCHIFHFSGLSSVFLWYSFSHRSFKILVLFSCQSVSSLFQWPVKSDRDPKDSRSWGWEWKDEQQYKDLNTTSRWVGQTVGAGAVGGCDSTGFTKVLRPHALGSASLCLDTGSVSYQWFEVGRFA